jgi:hypothetical protein
MSRRRFHKQSSARILAAVSGAAAAAAAGVGVQSAHAGLLIELRAAPGAGYSVSNNGKAVDAPIGTTVTLDVFARLSGTNSVQLSGNFDAQGDAPDTRNDESLDIVAGSFTSGFGGLRGNMNSGPGPLDYDSRVAPFFLPGSQNGVASDFDSDGDLDIGTNGANTATMWAVRSGASTYATRLDGTTDGWTNTMLGGGGPPMGWGEEAGDTLINATTSVLRVGTLQFTVTGGSGAASLNYIPAPPIVGAALWWEDAVTTGKTEQNASFAVGSPVVIGLVVPEPSGLSAAAAALIGLTLRRRQPGG